MFVVQLKQVKKNSCLGYEEEEKRLGFYSHFFYFNNIILNLNHFVTCLH